MSRYLILFMISLLLCSCSSMRTKHDGYCNELKSRIIFSGATGDTRQAEIQRAQQPLTVQNYDQDCT